MPRFSANLGHLFVEYPLIERINAHYGWRCIGRIVLKQGPVTRRKVRDPEPALAILFEPLVQIEKLPLTEGTPIRRPRNAASLRPRSSNSIRKAMWCRPGAVLVRAMTGPNRSTAFASTTMASSGSAATTGTTASC